MITMNRIALPSARTLLATAALAAMVALPAVAQDAAPAAPKAPATPKAPAAPKAPAKPAAPKVPAAPALKELPVEGQKPTAKDVFTKHLDATGGKAAWEAKKSMVAKGSIEIPAAQLKGAMNTVAASPDRVAVSMDLPGIGTTAQCFDGTTGWSMDPMRGPALMGEKEVAQVKRDANFLRDLQMANDPGTAEVAGLVEFEGAPCWHVKVDGTSFLYSKDTGLMKGMMMSAATPMGDLPVTVLMEEYKDFGDVKMATRSTTKVMGQTQVMSFDSVEWNAAKDDAFAMPAEIKAMKDAAAKEAPAPAAKDATKDAPKAAP
jgi:hypothetical protein